MKNKDYLKGITQKWTSKNKTGQNKTGQNKTDQNKTDKQNFQESIYNITRLEPAATIGERKKAKLLKKTAWWKNGKNQLGSFILVSFILASFILASFIFASPFLCYSF